jgi:hypothetical protein
MSSETYFNASQAAKHSGVNVVTIRDYLAKGKLPNAKQVPKGKVKVWQIPLTDLAAAGLLDKVSSASESQAKEIRSSALESRISELETELRMTQELLAEVKADRDYLRTRVPAQLETRATQEQRRFSWFKRNN